MGFFRRVFLPLNCKGAMKQAGYWLFANIIKITKSQKLVKPETVF
jgi:hypothetical protein